MSNIEKNQTLVTLDDMLPSLQKRSFVYLAENEPKTIRGVKTGLNTDYHNTHTAMKNLAVKKLIQVVDAIDGYERFWLTSSGVFVAVCTGVNSKKLMEKALAIYPKDEFLHYFIEVSPLLGIKGFDLACLAIIKKGTIEQSDILKLATVNDFDVENTEKVIEITKKYPALYEPNKLKWEVALEAFRKYRSKSH